MAPVPTGPGDAGEAMGERRVQGSLNSNLLIDSSFLREGELVPFELLVEGGREIILLLSSVQLFQDHPPPNWDGDSGKHLRASWNIGPNHMPSFLQSECKLSENVRVEKVSAS